MTGTQLLPWWHHTEVAQAGPSVEGGGSRAPEATSLCGRRLGIWFAKLCLPDADPSGGSFSEETEKKFEHFSGLINNQLSRR